MKRTIILPALITAFVALSPAGVALADNPHDHGNIGQPDQSLEDQPSHPPGFDTGTPGTGQGATTKGFANAETQYAGADGTPSLQHSQSGKAVSQYDVAAFQFSNRGPN